MFAGIFGSTQEPSGLTCTLRFRTETVQFWFSCARAVRQRANINPTEFSTRLRTMVVFRSVRTDYCVKVALTKPFEKPDGRVTLAFAVEAAKAPASGVDRMVWSGPFSEKITRVTTVPTGTFAAVIATARGPFEFTVTSGTVNVPVGEVATGFPPTLTTRTAGMPAKERKRPKGVPV